MRGGENKSPTIEQTISRRRESAIVRHEYLMLLGRVIVLAALVWLVFTKGFLICQNVGQDMFPAMKDGDLCVIFRTELMNLTGDTLKSNDIVAYRVDGERHFGRVAAIAGDTIQIDTRGSVTVNGTTESNEILFPPTQEGTC